MNKKTLYFGLASGLAGAIFFLGPWLFIDLKTLTPADLAGSEVIGYTTMLLSMCFVPIGIYSYRKSELGGSIGFWPALKVGLIITGISVLTFYLFNVLLYEVIDPNFLSDFMAIYPDVMAEQLKNDPVKLQETLAVIEQNGDLYTNGWFYGMMMAGSTLMMGIVLALISALAFLWIDGRK